MAHKKTLLGIGIGVAGALVAPLAGPTLAAAARPLIKGAVKHALLGFNLLREKLAVALEELDDLLAEVKSEVGDELARKGAPGAQRAAPSVEGPPSSRNGKAEHPPAGPHAQVRRVVS